MGLLKLFPLDFKKSEKNGLLVKSYCLSILVNEVCNQKMQLQDFMTQKCAKTG